MKQKRKKKKKASPVQQILTNQLFAIILIGLSIFLLIHQFLDNQEGIIGLSIEVATLYSFGTLGHLILPLCLVLSGLLSTISKQKIPQQILNTCIVFISTHILSYGLFFTFDSPSLKRLGHIGHLLFSTGVIFFGKTGILIIVTLLLLS
ncbi:hypothetical protein DID78_01370, partial [Candidatus Marinamargulisbacteria bacterium SCGC AG-343-D04]